MEIKVVDFTKRVPRAWKTSRPNEKNVDFDRIKKLDLPVNEFMCFHLEIESNLFLREVFSTQRNHVMWAQTSRVNNVLEFETQKISYSETKVYLDEARRIMTVDAANGVPQDIYREKLPMLSLTKYSIMIDIRNLIKTTNWLQLVLASKVFMETELKRSIKAAVKALTRFVEGAGYSCSYYNAKEIMPRLTSREIKEHYQTGRLNDTISITCDVPFSLRAQLVRHRGIFDYRDDLLDRVTTRFNGDYFDLSTTVTCNFTTNIEFAESIIKQRYCWIANYKIWKPLIQEFQKIIPEMDKMLPCGGGSPCPYVGDLKLRYEGKDPNPPCPIDVQRINAKISQDQKNSIVKMVESDERDEFWKTKAMGVQ